MTNNQISSYTHLKRIKIKFWQHCPQTYFLHNESLIENGITGNPWNLKTFGHLKLLIKQKNSNV